MINLKYCLFLVFDSVVAALIRVKRGDKVGILRLDAIGDFILWQPYARFLREAFPSREIVLVGNASNADLACKLPQWDSFIGVDTQKLDNDIAYRFALLRMLRRAGFGTVVHPVHSRTTRADLLVRAIGASERVGMGGDCANMRRAVKAVTARWYTRLIQSPGDKMHEGARCRDFVSALVGRPLALLAPSLPEFGSTPLAVRGRRYVVLFPGALSPGRRWPIERFAEVGREISSERGWDVVIAGGPDDVPLAHELRQQLGEGVIDLTGLTSLVTLIDLIRYASLLLTNETSAVHIAAAVGTRCVCILGGGHFGRFMPYPEECGRDGPLPVSAVEHMDCFGCNWLCRFDTPPDKPKPCVERVQASRVIELSRSLMYKS